jgi:stalled ribosome rescue protein Dom34
MTHSSDVSIVWLDLEQARLFQLSDERMIRESFHASRVDHHTHRLDNDERDPTSMYDKLAARLANARRIVIIGPGVSRKHFLSRLQDKHPALARRVVACEAADHPTDGQIAAYAEKFARVPVRA